MCTTFTITATIVTLTCTIITKSISATIMSTAALVITVDITAILWTVSTTTYDYYMNCDFYSNSYRQYNIYNCYY